MFTKSDVSLYEEERLFYAVYKAPGTGRHESITQRTDPRHKFDASPSRGNEVTIPVARISGHNAIRTRYREISHAVYHQFDLE